MSSGVLGIKNFALRVMTAAAVLATVVAGLGLLPPDAGWGPTPGQSRSETGRSDQDLTSRIGGTKTTNAVGAGSADRAPVASAPVAPKVREISLSSRASAARTSANRDEPHAPATSPPVNRVDPPRPTSPAATASAKQNPSPTIHGLPVVLTSKPQAAAGYATVGVTWRAGGRIYGENQIAVEIRTEKGDAWSKWGRAIFNAEEGPAPSAEGSGAVRPGTDPLIVGNVDQVQMRLATVDRKQPPDLKLVVIDPGTGKQVVAAPAIDTSQLPGSRDATGGGQQPNRSGQGASDDSASLSAMKVAPKPYIYSRAQWGANERMRDQTAPSYGTIQTGFIHHTVNANNYTAAEVPALLRGIYAYHTQSKGWRDIGYNFLVDRFGRIWEGRYGGVNRPVVGAHTLGYNEYSFAMSAIGNFDILSPPQAVVDAYARLFAWKLSLSNIRADSTRLRVKDKWLNAINGHRDVGATACPGRYLYAKVPAIRLAAQRIQNAAQGGATPPPPTTPPPAPIPPAPNPPPAPANVFVSPTQKPRPAVAQPSSITLPRSLNLAGSTYPDLVMKDASGAVKILATGGQMNYRTVGVTRGRWSSMTLLAAVNDVTGDGKGDVLGRVGRRATRIYRGDGAGHVSKAGIAPTSLFRRANKVVAAGDFDGAGRNDVLMRQRSNGGLYLVPGRGRGKFGQPRLLGRGWREYSSIAVPGDLTGDGRPDVVGVKNGVMYVFPNVGGNRIRSAVQRQTVGSAYDAVLGSGRDVTGGGVGDLLVRARSTGAFGVLTGRTGSTFGITMGWFPGAARWTRLSAGQMSGSPQADLIGVAPNGKQLLVMANNGLSNYQALVSTNIKNSGLTMLINAGDWNRDGVGDLIARDGSKDRLVLYSGLGNGQYRPGVLMSKGWKSFVNIVGVGDVTGDGRPDLMGRIHGGPMTIFPGNGTSKFQAPILAPASMRTFNQIGTGSWRPGSMPTSSIYGPGGAFVPFVRTGGRITSIYNWVVGPGDVDGDGRPDLVARDTAGALWVLPGTATGYGTRRFLAEGFLGARFIG